MDPNAAWAELIQALNSGDLAGGIDIATDLRTWLNRGGFPPTVIPQLEIDDKENSQLAHNLQHELAVRACDFVLSFQ